MATQIEDPAVAAYELLAPFYDLYTHDYAHEELLGNIEGIALEHGLVGRRLLDVGCGTGKSFMPMLARGYDVTACDISPGMVERAREAGGDGADVFVADARELPDVGPFDLTIALDDALNYLLSDEELAMVFDGAARNLRPGGLLVFDLNSLLTYRQFFTRDVATEVGDAFFCWRGEEQAEEFVAGSVASSVIEVFSSSEGGDCWRRYSSRHVQRHHPPEAVGRLLSDAGFELLSRRGLMSGTHIDAVGDDELHVKLLYFARLVRTY
jgi:SAM-dependent methyltransferase